MVSSGRLRKTILLMDGRLPPVALEGLDDQLHARVEAHELVRAGAHRGLAVALLADALEVLLRHHPARAGGERAVEGPEVGPRLLEDELHPVRRGRLDLLDRVLQHLGGAAPVALEGELHVLRGDRLAVVELRGPQHELRREHVLGHGPRLRQARARAHAGHRLDQPVVEHVEQEIGRDGALALRGVQPPRDRAEVHRDGERALRRRGRAGCPHEPSMAQRIAPTRTRREAGRERVMDARLLNVRAPLSRA